MKNFELCYEIKGRMSPEDDWFIVSVCAGQEAFDESLAKHKAVWTHLIWNSRRAAKRKDAK